MPLLAMAYVLTGEKQYLDAARRWALASCGYKTWGLGRIDGMDLAAGHQLFGLAIVYDWCYRDLDEAARRQIRETLVKTDRRPCSRRRRRARPGGIGPICRTISGSTSRAWRPRGLALFDEVDDAACWIGLPLDKFRRTMAALGPDGASHEGVGYWEYGVEYMLKFMDLARQRLDVDLYGYDWWRNTSAYAQYLALPRNAWTRENCIVDIADCPREPLVWPGVSAAGIGAAISRRPCPMAGPADRRGERFLGRGLLAEPPLVRPQPCRRNRRRRGRRCATSRTWGSSRRVPAGRATSRCWSSSAGRSSATKPSPGSPTIRAAGTYIPDANHFVLFGGGQWLIRDDGYQPKWTGQHNTLLVNGRGQLGEGAEWFNGGQALALKARPRVLRAVSTPALDQITGDAAEAYPRDLGLRRFVRHVIFVKPDVLIVADDILLDEEASLELRFHPEQEAVRNGNVFLATGKRATVRLEPLTAEGLQIAAESMPLPGHEDQAKTSMFTIRLNTRRSAWRNAVALSWSAAGKAAGPSDPAGGRAKMDFCRQGSPVDIGLDDGENPVITPA